MVVVGAARVGNRGGRKDGRARSVTWQRDHVRQQQKQQDKQSCSRPAAQDGDTLPVVELRPFTTKVWRRDNSLANLQQPTTVNQENQGTESAHLSTNTTPPSTDHVLEALKEPRRGAGLRHSAPASSSWRHVRGLRHPQPQFCLQAWYGQQSPHLSPPFSSRQQRTRTALTHRPAAADTDTRRAEDEGAAGGDCSRLLAAYTHNKQLQQEKDVCLRGDKAPMGHVGRRHLAYLNPYTAYHRRQTWGGPLHNSPVSGSPLHHVSLSLIGAGGEESPTHQYIAHRLVLSGSPMHVSDRLPTQSLEAGSSSPHPFNRKLGAAKDAHQALSRTGPPTVLERHLSFDHALRLDRCRRERTFTAITDLASPASARSHGPVYDTQPTPGELLLRQAQQANKPRDRITNRRGGQDRRGATQARSVHVPARLDVWVSGHLQDDRPRSDTSHDVKSDTSQDVKSDASQQDSGLTSSLGETGEEDLCSQSDLASGLPQQHQAGITAATHKTSDDSPVIHVWTPAHKPLVDEETEGDEVDSLSVVQISDQRPHSHTADTRTAARVLQTPPCDPVESESDLRSVSPQPAMGAGARSADANNKNSPAAGAGVSEKQDTSIEDKGKRNEDSKLHKPHFASNLVSSSNDINNGDTDVSVTNARRQESRPEGSAATVSETGSTPATDVTAQGNLPGDKALRGANTKVTTNDADGTVDNFDGSKTFLTTSNVDAEEP